MSAIAPTALVTWRAVLIRGLADHRRAVLGWGAGLAIYGGFMAAVYPSVRDSIGQVAAHYPPALKQAFGVTSLSTVEGYLQAELFSLIVPLLLGFFAIRVVVAPTVGASERGDLDTLLSLPLSRTALMLGACAVAVLASAGVLLLTGVGILVLGLVADSGISVGRVGAGLLGVWGLTVFATGVGSLSAASLRSARGASELALGVLVLMYALDLVAKLAPSLSGLRFGSAFALYGAPMRDGLRPLTLLGLLALGGVLAGLGTLRFERRDLVR